jgi:chlorobactene glucosyltransferase
VAVNVAWAPRLHGLPAAAAGPLVSVLVPARDEAANLRRLLPALARTLYPELEVLVLDDGSRDETAAVVRGTAATDPRIRLIQGVDPPVGWTGKNWACHQLSRHARGELLVVCDADVVPRPDAIGRTAAHLLQGGVDVLTAFPRHQRGGWIEEALVPLLTRVPVAALLPLPLVRHSSWQSLSAGNGQWFAWRRSAYHAVGGHARVRDDILEDVRLARLAKGAGLQLATVLAIRDLDVRMYHSGGEAWAGFTKNAYALGGGADRRFLPALALFAAITLGPFVAVAVAPLEPLAWLALGMILLLRGGVAILFEDGPRTVLLHPVGATAVVALALTSRHRHRKGTLQWKRRVLRTEEAR